MSGSATNDRGGALSVKAGSGTEVEMDEMECVCGEVFRAPKGKGLLAAQYAEHIKRPDHNASPAQWTEAQKRIEAAKERQKSKPQL
jgi:hypothetical protein